MKTLCYFFLIGFTFLGLSACTNSTNSKDSVKEADETNDVVFENDIDAGFLNDADFMVLSYNSGLTEIEIGNIAQNNAEDQGVKDLGKSAVDDFSKMNKTLKAIADKESITLPAKMDNKSEKQIEELKEKKGNIFDRAFTERMIEKHTKEIRRFEDAVNSVSDPEIQSFASETLQMLRKHLNATEELKVRIPYY